jgi:hypothetical protein
VAGWPAVTPGVAPRRTTPRRWLQILKRSPQAAMMTFAAFMWLDKKGEREVGGHGQRLLGGRRPRVWPPRARWQRVTTFTCAAAPTRPMRARPTP